MSIVTSKHYVTITMQVSQQMKENVRDNQPIKHTNNNTLVVDGMDYLDSLTQKEINNLLKKIDRMKKANKKNKIRKSDGEGGLNVA